MYINVKLIPQNIYKIDFFNKCWCGELIFHTDYFRRYLYWNLFHKQCSRRSFFWNGILQALSSFRKNLISIIQDGASTLFWFDNWVEGRAPADNWPDLLLSKSNKKGIIKELVDSTPHASLGDCCVSHLG